MVVLYDIDGGSDVAVPAVAVRASVFVLVHGVEVESKIMYSFRAWQYRETAGFLISSSSEHILQVTAGERLRTTSVHPCSVASNCLSCLKIFATQLFLGSEGESTYIFRTSLHEFIHHLTYEVIKDA